MLRVIFSIFKLKFIPATSLIKFRSVLGGGLECGDLNYISGFQDTESCVH